MTTHPDESVYRAAADQVAILHGYHHDAVERERYTTRQAQDAALRLIVDTAWRLAQPPADEPVSSCTEWAIRTTFTEFTEPSLHPIVCGDAGRQADEDIARKVYRNGAHRWVRPDDVERVELVTRETITYGDGWERTSPWTVVDTTMKE